MSFSALGGVTRVTRNKIYAVELAPPNIMLIVCMRYQDDRAAPLGGIGLGDRTGCVCGGALGIRTLDTIAGIPHFECGAFDHSANAPHRRGSI